MKYGLILSNFKAKGCFCQCNVAGWLLLVSKLGLLDSGMEDYF